MSAQFTRAEWNSAGKLDRHVASVPTHLVSTLEPCGEDGAQWVGNAQHDLSEAARQHTDEVLVLWHILVHTAVVVVEASLHTPHHQ